MGFRNGAYATVWEIKSSTPTVVRARISTSKKNKNTGEYETDFSGFVSFVGADTAAKADNLKQRDRIRLGDVDVTVRYNKEKDVTYTNFTIFNFELADGQTNSIQNTVQNVDNGEPESDLPF